MIQVSPSKENSYLRWFNHRQLNVLSGYHLLMTVCFSFSYRCNTSLLIDYCQGDGVHEYILIDCGKTFREQVLRWFTHHKIPRVDSVGIIITNFFIMLYISFLFYGRVLSACYLASNWKWMFVWFHALYCCSHVSNFCVYCD